MSLRATLLLMMIALLGAPLAHAAKLYKWVDKDGNVSYQDRPPPSRAGDRVEEKTLRGRTTAPGADDAARKFPVVLFSAPKCASCDTARAYLKKRGIPFVEKNVEGDRQLQEELIQKAGGLAVPTITVGSKVMQGYLESLLEGELDQAGYPKPQSAPQSPEPEAYAPPTS